MAPSPVGAPLTPYTNPEALMQHPIMSMVRACCKRIGVRVVVTRSPQTHLGGFCSESKTIYLSRRYYRSKGRVRGRPRVQETSENEFLRTAIHEMSHALQWYRKDKNWHDVNARRGERWSDLIIKYDMGDEWYPADELWRSAQTLAELEFEAEMNSFSIMQMFGEFTSKSASIKWAKAYALSYLVLAKTGVSAGPKTYYKWFKHLTRNPMWDVSSEALDAACEIAISDKDTATTVWDGNVCKKKP